MYTVKRLADLAGVTVRTLHYYDQIDLLNPTTIADNGYRHYDDDALLRLQQILFYREMGLELLEIKTILDDPTFDVVTALESHRTVIQTKMRRLEHLIDTVDNTIDHLRGERKMKNKRKLFDGFNEEKQKEYEREARLEYGPDEVNDSINRWNSYSKDRQQAIIEDGNDIYADIAEALEAGKAPQDEDVQTLLDRWREHLRHFYEPSLDRLRGLGELYNSHPDFMANFQKLHADLPQYLEDAIAQYVDDLETEAIKRLLAEDDLADQQ